MYPFSEIISYPCKNMYYILCKLYTHFCKIFRTPVNNMRYILYKLYTRVWKRFRTPVKNMYYTLPVTDIAAHRHMSRTLQLTDPCHGHAAPVSKYFVPLLRICTIYYANCIHIFVKYFVPL